MLFHLPFTMLRSCLVMGCFIMFVDVTVAQSSRFNIFKGSDQVGTIHVNKSFMGEQVLYSMESISEIRLIWKQVVRTSVRTEYLQGDVKACSSSITVNDVVRDSSHMYMRNGDDHCYVHPNTLPQCVQAGDWTTARMYFEEPINATMVFVESVLQNCPLIRSNEGIYTLTFPNNTHNHYVYRRGQLQEIQVIRPFFDLVFRRSA